MKTSVPNIKQKRGFLIYESIKRFPKIDDKPLSTKV